MGGTPEDDRYKGYRLADWRDRFDAVNFSAYEWWDERRTVEVATAPTLDELKQKLDRLGDRDIGIRIRPDVLRHRQRGLVAYWHFHSGLPNVVPGRKLWISVVDRKWAGYFIIKELLPDTQEIAWDPSSWVASEDPWPDDLEIRRGSLFVRDVRAPERMVFQTVAEPYTDVVPTLARPASKVVHF